MKLTYTLITALFLLGTIPVISQKKENRKLEKEVGLMLDTIFGKLTPDIANVLADSGATNGAHLKYGKWNEYSYRPCIFCEPHRINYDSMLMFHTEDPGNITVIKETGEYKNGKRENYWFTYSAMELAEPFDWSLGIKVNYVNGKKEGWECTYSYAEYGNASSLYERKRVFYKNGVEDGPIIGFNEKGDTVLAGQFKDGLGQGLFKFRNDSVQELNFDRLYVDGEEVETIFYHENGKVASRGKLIDFQPHGLYKMYDTTGILIAEQNFDKGILEGESTIYVNGKIHERHNFKNNEIEGLSRYYHANGQLWTVVEIKDGKVWNVLSNFDRDGKLQDKGSLKNGNGTINRYSEEGDLIAVDNYKNGKEVVKKKKK